MEIKKGDFVELEYTGSITETNEVFDTTKEAVAKEHNIFEEKQTYKPAIICVGEQQLLKGIDEQLVSKTVGTHTFELKPEQAFGRKSAKLIQLISTNKFKAQGIAPVPGLQMNIDGTLGTVKTVSGGRTIVDFNHPLSGKDLSYTVEVKRLVDDPKEQIHSYLEQMHLNDFSVAVENEKASISVKQDIPKEIQQKLTEKLKKLVKIKDIEFKKTS